MAQSRLQQRALLPGDVVPNYRYRTWYTTGGPGAIDSYVSAGGGSMVFTELTTSSLAAPEWDAATDDHAGIIAVPSDADIYAPIDLRLRWSSDQTTVADSYTWTVLYREIYEGISMDAAAATALDTVIAADVNNVVASAIQNTPWGTIAAGTLTGTEPDYELHYLIDPTTGGTISDDVVQVWAIQMRYQPKEV
jgi:hypothetical protein